MAEAQMMQRVIAILTQARELADQYDEDDQAGEEDALSAQALMMGELLTEALQVDGVTATVSSPQGIANAVIDAIQPKIGQLAGCFVAAFTGLAVRHDAGESHFTSAEFLRQMAIDWELND